MNPSEKDPLSPSYDLTQTVNLSDMSPLKSETTVSTESEKVIDPLTQSTPNIIYTNNAFIDPLSRPPDYSLSQSMNLLRMHKAQEQNKNSFGYSSGTSSSFTSNQKGSFGKETKKENLKGIYAFFGSSELPPNPKLVSINDIPQSLDAVPFIMQNKCYAQGADLMNHFMVMQLRRILLN
jgi:hypothetical protein